MASQFDAERDMREAQFCLVAIYPPVRGWMVDGAEEALVEAECLQSRDVELVRL